MATKELETDLKNDRTFISSLGSGRISGAIAKVRNA
jgi:hypothetical protein